MIFAAAAVIVAAIVVAGCGGGGSSSSSSESKSTEAPGGKADVAAAEAAIKPYVGHSYPPFPVDEPLKEAPSADTSFSQIVFGSPVGAIIGELTEQAAATAGVHLNTVKGGSTASSTQSAAQTMISQSPNAILLPSVEPQTITTQLKEMQEQEIPVYSSGVLDPQKYGITGYMFDEAQTLLVGKLLADWVIAKHGDEANVVLYETPELGFTASVVESFEAEMGKVCPECQFRTAVITAAELGSGVGNTVVSDLQAHPDTNAAVFSATSTSGLPAALKAAGINVDISGFAADPATVEYIKAGEIESTLTFDYPVGTWTQFDMALRGSQGMPLTSGEKLGIVPMQFLTQEDINFDPSKGWTSEPNYVKSFEKLWKVGQ